MKNEEIKQLFQEISSNFDRVPAGTEELFSILINETALYRDEIIEEGGEPLVVKDVQTALNGLEQCIFTKSFPKDLPQRSEILLTRWLKRLNEPSEDK